MEVSRLSQVVTRQMSATARKQYERGLLKYEQGSINKAMSIRGQDISSLEAKLVDQSLTLSDKISLKMKLGFLKSIQIVDRQALKSIKESLKTGLRA